MGIKCAFVVLALVATLAGQAAGQAARNETDDEFMCVTGAEIDESPAKMLAACNRAIAARRRDRSLARYLQGRAEVYFDLGNYAASIRDFDDAISLVEPGPYKDLLIRYRQGPVKCLSNPQPCKRR
jgi:tetratricopeptide (TPR) repeat protein